METTKEGKFIGMTIVAVLMMLVTIGFALAFFKTADDLKAAKQVESTGFNLEGALAIESNESQTIQLLYNGSSYFPLKIQIKEGIVFWEDGNKIRCADRSQVQIYIMTLTTGANV